MPILIILLFGVALLALILSFLLSRIRAGLSFLVPLLFFVLAVVLVIALEAGVMPFGVDAHGITIFIVAAVFLALVLLVFSLVFFLTSRD